MIYSFDGRMPSLPDEYYVAGSAEVIGDVRLGSRSSIWFGAVLRGDIEPIIIGERSNVQDHSVAHTSRDRPVILGSDVTVGHRVVLHGCRIGRNCLIGMGAILLDGCIIGDNCMIGAGSVVGQDREIPAGSLAVGTPAKVIRTLSGEDIASIRGFADRYVKLQARYRAGALKPL